MLSFSFILQLGGELPELAHKMNRKYLVFISLLIGTGVIIFLSSSLLNKQASTETNETAVTIAEKVKVNNLNVSGEQKEFIKGTENSLTKRDGQGAVVVDVTYLNPTVNDQTYLIFEVVLNTHTVDLLQYDYSKIAAISTTKDDRLTGNFIWEPINNDGHHAKGLLKWPQSEGSLLTNQLTSLTLELQGIDEIPSRTFTWNNDELQMNE